MEWKSSTGDKSDGAMKLLWNIGGKFGVFLTLHVCTSRPAVALGLTRPPLEAVLGLKSQISWGKIWTGGRPDYVTTWSGLKKRLRCVLESSKYAVFLLRSIIFLIGKAIIGFIKYSIERNFIDKQFSSQIIRLSCATVKNSNKLM